MGEEDTKDEHRESEIRKRGARRALSQRNRHGETKGDGDGGNERG